MAIATFCLVALDRPGPSSLAHFHAGVLDGEVKRWNEDRYDPYTPGGTRIAFQRAAGHQPPTWPSADHDAQQAHLDLDVADTDRAQRQVLTLGAKPPDPDDSDGRDVRVFADPAGHPFCLCRIQP